MTDGNHLPPIPHHEAYEFDRLDEDLRFMINFAVAAGDAAADMRDEAEATEKPDRTVVTEWDKRIEREFREVVYTRSNGQDKVIGEEEKSEPLSGVGSEWIIDPIDGTGEYIRDDIEDSERTTCVGIAQFKDGRLVRAVVYNPFRRELFVADDELGGAFLNGELLRVTDTEIGSTPFVPDIPYDYAHWDEAAIDPRFFEQVLGRPPLGSFSAINQGLAVARGHSAFAVFSGNTIHDIAPAAKIVEMAGGIVSAPDGQPLDWQNLNGAVYSANQTVHAGVVQELNRLR